MNRLTSGRYCCEAGNTEGSAKSSAFHLRVKFQPVCTDGPMKKLLGAAKDEPLKVDCKVRNVQHNNTILFHVHYNFSVDIKGKEDITTNFFGANVFVCRLLGPPLHSHCHLQLINSSLALNVISQSPGQPPFRSSSFLSSSARELFSSQCSPCNKN